ncbi:MAG: mechanosensitive ion channel [Intestinibacter sp.]|nr:mechanosensitive ion channel domain-containing protein [Intestinibacter sp.]MDY2736216.1 mechanosensitive ion channel [Intestinibacter sp.]MDY4574913.1 mechanosensitive ion channel [Intestinibacter sp.]
MRRLSNWALNDGINAGVKLIIGVLVIIIGFKLINKVSNKFLKFAELKSIDVTLVKFLKSFINISLKCLLLLIIIGGYWDIELTGFAAILASAGVAIGLALQGSLSNFAGGFIILFLRPFKVGDYIQAAGFEGTVEQIGVFYTNLATVDNKLVMIPNGTLSNGSLINFTAKETRRVDFIFSVGYDTELLKVRRVLKDIVDKHNLILSKPEPFIGLVEHNASSLDFAVRVWVKTEDYWTVYFDLLETVKNRFDEENINIPYPQMDLHFINQINQKQD